MIRLSLILCLLATLATAKPKKPVPKKSADKTEKSVIEKSEKSISDHHIMSGMTLQGKLKQPELQYSYSKEDLKNDQVLEVPENFQDEFIQDTE